ncbi:MAG: GxxExxY protein [Bacteroidia bacterium]|nr:GxxExxY protein [Bacteroidia bacterium]
MMMNELTEKIIGCAIEVHRHLGAGLLESVYEECLFFELTFSGLSVERQKPLPIIYKQVKLDCGYRLDMLVENTVIVELKTVEALSTIHEAQILTYLKLSQKKIGLLLNFNTKLLKDGIRRYVM